MSVYDINGRNIASSSGTSGYGDGKTFVFIGDSIPTFGSQTGGIGAIPDYMAELVGGTWHNFAVGGTTLSAYRLDDDAFEYFTFDELADSIASGNFNNQSIGVDNGVPANEKVVNMKLLDWSTVDTICINFGTNDLAYKVSQVGTHTDSATKNGTLCGALKYGVNQILSVYPKMKIAFNGVIFRHADSINMDDVLSANEELKKTCNDLGIRYVDQQKMMEMNTTNYASFLYDGTHPNGDGKLRYAECLAKHIY